MNNIYAICTYERVEYDKIHKCPDMGDQAIPALYFSLSSAEAALQETETALQIYNGIYNYVLISEIGEGMYNAHEYSWWRWSNSEQIYQHISRPSKLNGPLLMGSNDGSQSNDIGPIGHVY